MENSKADLTITDLAVLQNCIDLACTRGAFRANEMKTVGEIYEKLTIFLQTIVAQAESQQTPSNSQGDTNA